MIINQSLPSPNGITVYGSGRVRAKPDFATFCFTVSSQHRQAKKAFNQLREKVVLLETLLLKLKVKKEDIQVSEMNIDEQKMFLKDGIATVAHFNVRIRHLPDLENILIGITENVAANFTSSIDFGTSRLKEIRTQARRKAVEAALEKAQLYADAAGIGVGLPLHIEDLNPDKLQNPHYSPTTGRYDGSTSFILDDDSFFESRWIPVDAAVMITYNIEKKTVKEKDCV